MTFKFARMEIDGLKRYSFETYEEVENWVKNELDIFKKTNRVDNENNDRSFISYKSVLDTTLINAKEKLCTISTNAVNVCPENTKESIVDVK